MKFPNVINGFAIPFYLKINTRQNKNSRYRYGALQPFEC